MTAGLRRRLLIPAIIASLALAAGCSTTCPSRQAAAQPEALSECARLAPRATAGQPAVSPPPEAMAPGATAPEAAPAPSEEGVQVGPGPEARAATPLGAVPPGMYRVHPGDSLWDISARAYGDPFKWRAIYQANRSGISDPDLIYPNQELTIPKAG